MKRVLPAVLFVFVLCTFLDGAADPKPADIPRVRDIDTWIDLSGPVRPAAVLCPDQPTYREAAQAIADAIENLGVARPTVSCDPRAATPQTHNVIALGNVNYLEWNRAYP